MASTLSYGLETPKQNETSNIPDIKQQIDKRMSESSIITNQYNDNLRYQTGSSSKRKSLKSHRKTHHISQVAVLQQGWGTCIACFSQCVLVQSDRDILC